MPSTLDYARESLTAGTLRWFRHSWGKMVPLFLGGMAKESVSVIAIIVATPFAPLIAWIQRRRDRKECEAAGVEWRKEK